MQNSYLSDSDIFARDERMHSQLKYVKGQVAELSQEYYTQVGRREANQQLYDEATAKLKHLEEREDTLLQTNILLRKVAQYQRQQACFEIEEMATHALQRIFGPHLSLQIRIKESNRSRPEAEVLVIKNQDDVITIGAPEESHGGGVVNVISVALRLIVIQLLDPEITGPIMLDEPTANISSELVQPFHEFLKEICDKFDRQIILITHQGITNADNAIHIAQDADGKSYIASAERSSQYG